MLMRFDPFRDAENRLQLFNRQMGAPPMTMSMDAYRDGDRFIVQFDLPGIDPGSIDLTVEKNVLTVRAERKWETRDDQEIVISERVQGSFSRQLFLGESLDAEHVEARYDNGVLTLSIPVAEQAKPRKVAITTSSDETEVAAKATTGSSAAA
jgi:HSP20 family protein